MDYGKKYDEALERAKRKIDAGFLATADLLYIFPELVESEDERIRKEILAFVIDMDCKEIWIHYLEKQKEQKPAEWSEEEKMDIELLIALLRGKVNLIEILDSRKESIIHFLKSLRPSWKPSEEQMEALYEAAQDAAIDRESGNALYELYEQLKKL